MKSSDEEDVTHDGEDDYHRMKLMKLEADGYVRWDGEKEELVVVTQREINEGR